MDDNELKSLWQSDANATNTAKPDIDLLLKGKSKGVLEKLQKTAKYEHYLNIILTVILTGFLLYEQMWYHVLGFLALMAFIIFYYKKLYDKVLNISYTENVLEYLLDIYNTMKDFKKKYFIGLLIIFPISFIFGFDLGYDLGHSVESSKEITEELERYDETTEIVIFIVTITFTLLLSAVVIHYIFYFMYGRRIKQIKEMIDNLKNNEE